MSFSSSHVSWVQILNSISIREYFTVIKVSFIPYVKTIKVSFLVYFACIKKGKIRYKRTLLTQGIKVLLSLEQAAYLDK